MMRFSVRRFLHPVGVFAICACLIALTGYLVFEGFRAHERKAAGETLAGIGRLKVAGIVAFLDERKGDARIVSALLATEPAQRWLNPAPAPALTPAVRRGGEMPEALSGLLDSMLQSYHYRDVLLLDAQANVRLSARRGSGHDGAMTAAARAAALETMRARRPVSFRIHFGDPAAPETPVLDTFVPIMSLDGAHAVGAVAMRSPPDFLFRLIQSWPSESTTAESLLVAREGDEVVFLNELRHHKNAALRLRVPLADDPQSPAWSAISAVSGRYGLFDANDYRGRRVMAYTLAVPETSWGVVVKMDLDEITEHTQSLQRVALIAMATMIVLAGIAIRQWQRRDRAERQAGMRMQETQARLLASEAELKEAQRLGHIGNWSQDLASGAVAWSDETFRILGLAPGSREPDAAYFLSLVPEAERDRLLSEFERAVETLRGYAIEHRLLLPDGQTKWVVENSGILCDTAGQPTHIIGTIQDITARKTAEISLHEAQARLLESEAALKDAQRIAHVGNWKLFLATNEVFWSDEIYRIFGLEPGSREPSRSYYYAMIPPEEREPMRASFMNAIATGRSYETEHRLILGNGMVKWMHVNFSFIPDEAGQPAHVIGTTQDITARKEAELALQRTNDELKALNRQLVDTQAQLLQSEKLASIGQLAAGVAHEINNPIGYVHSNVNSLSRHLEDLLKILDGYLAAESAADKAAALAEAGRLKEQLDLGYLREDLVTLLEESKEGIRRVRQIVQDLKNFSRIDAEKSWERVDIHKGLDSTLNMVFNEIKYKADVIKDYGDLPEIECLPSQLNQVFMNLIVNAAHAMDGEKRGKLTLKTGRDRELVWIEVSDTGSGIAPENLKKIFDPFFTTKPVGQGTGLGLSLSYGIVMKHGGSLDVRSTVGQGTTFRVTLPVHQVAPPPQSAQSAQPLQP